MGQLLNYYFDVLFGIIFYFTLFVVHFIYN